MAAERACEGQRPAGQPGNLFMWGLDLTGLSRSKLTPGEALGTVRSAGMESRSATCRASACPIGCVEQRGVWGAGQALPHWVQKPSWWLRTAGLQGTST